MNMLSMKAPLTLVALIALTVGVASTPAFATHGRNDGDFRVSVSFGSYGSHGQIYRSRHDVPRYRHRSYHYRSYDNYYRPSYRHYYRPSYRHTYRPSRPSQHVHGHHGSRHGHGHSHNRRGRGRH